MTNFLLAKTVPILSLIGMFGLNQSKTVDLNPSYEIVSISKVSVGEPNYSTTTRIISMDGGCWTMQLNVYETMPSGTVFLRHTATIQTGKDCVGGDKVLSSQTFSTKSGPEYIIDDKLVSLNGPIQDFFAKNATVYKSFVAEKEKIMGIK